MTTNQQEQNRELSLATLSEITIDAEQLIAELDAGMGQFPEVALRDCQKHRDLMIPRLIEVLQETARLGCEGVVRDGNAAMFALFLLTEFRATQATDAIVNFLRVPGKVVDTLLGDAITEDLPRILATFATQRLEILELLITDSQADEYVRSGALEAHKYLVRDGVLQRPEFVQRLRDYLLKLVAEEAIWPATLVVDMLAELKAVDARPDIERAYHAGVIDEEFITLEFVDELLGQEAAEFDRVLDNLEPTIVADAVEEMRPWHWSGDESWLDGKVGPIDELEFDNELTSRIAHLFSNALVKESDPSMADDEAEEFSPHQTDTIRYDAPHIGRNDPCPCGSGKKYKKCCLHKVTPK
ncbi:MAG TPA: DUF1186 domain-containing protein [Pirellulaceae bacterium]|jgi:hypothetical protein